MSRQTGAKSSEATAAERARGGTGVEVVLLSLAQARRAAVAAPAEHAARVDQSATAAGHDPLKRRYQG
jgi:hypothetical protein